MKRNMKRALPLLCLLAAGCTVQASPRTTPPAAKPAARVAAETPRVIETGGAAELMGRVKLLSDHGAGLLGNNGASLMGRVKWGLLAETSAEAPLGGARVELLDAAGHLLVDKAGAAIATTSAADGSYHLQATLPDQDLVLRVQLGGGGELLAMRARPAGQARQQIDVDTASSLGGRLVLETMVDHQQDVFDRLPNAEAGALHEAYDGARTQLPADFVYTPAEELAAARDLEGKAPAVHTALERIRTLLLAGQSHLGNGRKATEVALAAPQVLLGDGHDGLYVAETPTARVRLLRPDGTIAVVVGGRDDPLLNASGLARQADGTLLVADALSGTVQRFGPTGTSSVLAKDLHHPTTLALAPDGTLYASEAPTGEAEPRVLRIDADGSLHPLDPPAAGWPKGQLVGMAVAPDGTLYVLDARASHVFKRKPGAAFEALPDGPRFDQLSRLSVGPDNALYASAADVGRVVKLGPDGWAPFAGTGQQGTSPEGTLALLADLGEPSGMAWGADGTFFLAEPGNGRVLAFDTAKRALRVLAGATGVTQVGTNTQIAVSSPFGAAFDAQGRLLFSEATASTIKRLDGSQLSVLAGSRRGPAVDGATLAAAQFNAPAAIARDGDLLYVIDLENRVLRKLDLAAGTVSTIAGCGLDVPAKPAPLIPALKLSLVRGTGLAVGPDHMPYVADNQSNRIWRIRPDGQAECIAGLNSPQTGGFGGDGGPAIDALLSLPTGLAFDARGDLYVADTGNAEIRKITGLGGPKPMIARFAGTPLSQLLPQIAGGALPADEGKPALQAVLLGVGPIAFDAHGDLVEAELGSSVLGRLLPGVDLAAAGLPRVGPRLRRIAADGASVRTIAGDGTAVLNDPDADEELVSPVGLAFDAVGRLAIADSGTNQVRLLPAP